MGDLFKAIGNIFMAIITLGQYKANRVADNVYTGSEDGVRAGYANLRDQYIDQFNQIVSGVSGTETIKTELEYRLEKLNKEEIELQNVVEGIIRAIEEDPENEQAVIDFSDNDKRQAQIDIEQEEIATKIEDITKILEDKQITLNKIKTDIENLKREEEESVSDLALAKLEAQIAQQEIGFDKSINRTGVQAIRESIAKKKATAKTLSRASGADTKKRMQKYKTKSDMSASNDKLQAILAQREAAKQASNASGNMTTPKKEKQI
jgi:hypothetical protein